MTSELTIDSTKPQVSCVCGATKYADHKYNCPTMIATNKGSAEHYYRENIKLREALEPFTGITMKQAAELNLCMQVKRARKLLSSEYREDENNIV